MVVRTGLLHVPELDESSSRKVRALLQNSISDSVVLLERGVDCQRNWIEETLRIWCDEEELDLILTIGGTYPAPGLSADEIVPDATQAVVERLLPGFSEAMRAYAQEETGLALLDRGVTGIRGRSLIINLPADDASATLFLESVVDLIEPVLLHLHRSPAAPRMVDDLEVEGRTNLRHDSGSPGTDSTPSGLNADEFAAFLDGREDGESGQGSGFA